MRVTLTVPLDSIAGDDESPVQTKTKREIILFNILNFYDIYWGVLCNLSWPGARVYPPALVLTKY